MRIKGARVRVLLREQYSNKVKVYRTINCIVPAYNIYNDITNGCRISISL